MDRFINLDLLRHPYNWVIVWLMIATAVVAMTYLSPPSATPR